MISRLSAASLRAIGLLVGVTAVALLITWLFVGADIVSGRAHQDYMRTLRALRFTDEQLNLSVLSNRMGLTRDFDDIERLVGESRSLVDAVRHLPEFVAADDQRALHESTLRYAETLETKVELLDRFKRQSAVLRNSLSYFPSAVERWQQARGGKTDATMDRLTRRILHLAATADDALGKELLEEINRLKPAQPPRDAGAAASTDFALVLRHAETIVRYVGSVNALTLDILSLPSERRAEDLIQAYTQGFEHAAAQARMFRLMLYLAAMLLAAYLLVALMSLGRSGRALKRTNANLEARLEELHRSQEQLRLYATVFTNASEGMTITDAQTHIVAVNPAFCEITGYDESSILGRTPAVLSSGRQDAAFYRTMWSTLERDGLWRGEIWNRKRDGTVYPEWLSISRVRNADGDTTHYIGIFSDISERKEAEARIQHMAHHDPLTNLPNRTLLHDRIEQAIVQARHDNRCAAVIFIDLDRFKLINDTMGHEVGDALLLQVARRCQMTLEDTATVARLGGDEFVIVLPDLEHAPTAAHFGRRLLSAMQTPYILNQHEITVTASLGIALYPDDGATASVLMRNADAAMYRAKSEGRNGMQFYSSDMNAASLGELLLENQLRGALERHELELHYQPRVDALNRRLQSLESLLRWRHPELGLVMPDRFIAMAEESGLIAPIGQWVMDAACAQIRAWQDAGLQPVPVSVNLSAIQFSRQDVPDLISDALSRHGIDPKYIELELTESVLMRDMQHTTRMINQLRQIGVRLAIDDFGTGYSSLGYLRLFDVDTMKIDRSFIHDIRPGGPDAKIVAAVIALGHSLGHTVVAEGVETEYQQVFLARHHCDELQGFLFGKAAPAEEITAWLKPAPPAPPETPK